MVSANKWVLLSKISVVLLHFITHAGDGSCGSFTQLSDHYRWPSIFNPNPVAGRLYVQPMGNWGDRIQQEATIGASYTTIAEYNPKFHPKDELSEQRINIHMLKLQAATGLSIANYPVEVGIDERFFVDDHENGFSLFLVDFHKAIDSLNAIPPDDASYQFLVGQNHTSVVGRKGHLYLIIGDLFAKTQLLDQEQGDPFSLVSKIVYRVPQSPQKFNTDGYGLALTGAYSFQPQLKMIGGIGLAHQNLRTEHFEAVNVIVRQNVYDWQLGYVHDVFSLGGFYYALSFRTSRVKVVYRRNQDSAKIPTMLHGSINYLSADQSWQTYLEFNEDIIITQSALEPDIIFTFGVLTHL